MIEFLFALACLSAIVYYFLDKEFKRLERKYALQRWISSTILANLQHFADKMLVFGNSAKQTSEAMAGIEKAFRKSDHSTGFAMDINAPPGRIMYLPKDGFTITRIKRPEE